MIRLESLTLVELELLAVNVKMQIRYRLESIPCPNCKGKLRLDREEEALFCDNCLDTYWVDEIRNDI